MRKLPPQIMRLLQAIQARQAQPRNPMRDDRVYAGGNPNFDMQTGQFTKGPLASAGPKGFMPSAKNMQIIKNIQANRSQLPQPDTFKGGPSSGGGIAGMMSGLKNLSSAPVSTGMKKGGKVKTTSKRGDGIAKKGKTRGKMV